MFSHREFAWEGYTSEVQIGGLGFFLGLFQTYILLMGVCKIFQHDWQTMKSAGLTGIYVTNISHSCLLYVSLSIFVNVTVYSHAGPSFKAKALILMAQQILNGIMKNWNCLTGITVK